MTRKRQKASDHLAQLNGLNADAAALSALGTMVGSTR